MGQMAKPLLDLTKGSSCVAACNTRDVQELAKRNHTRLGQSLSKQRNECVRNIVLSDPIFSQQPFEQLHILNVTEKLGVKGNNGYCDSGRPCIQFISMLQQTRCASGQQAT
eukprot:scaffold1996_cov377-Prasinococcus_capsulatus_cf.AAC.11